MLKYTLNKTILEIKMNMIRVAAKALIVKNNQVLILQRKRNSPNDKIEWDIPGGGIEYGESFSDALVREVKEETNLTVEVFDTIRAWNCIDNDKMLYGVTFATNFVEGDIILSSEHENYVWLDIDKIANSDVAKWIKDEVAILQKRIMER